MQDDSDKDEQNLFRDAMNNVKPLKPDNNVKHKPKPARNQRKASQPESYAFSVDTGFSNTEAADCPDILNFARSGPQHSVLKKLRQGKMPIDEKLDLHGMTIEEARRYLIEFLHECEVENYRTILIVHGKGYRSAGKKPVLKPLLNRWLRDVPEVLAFHSAQPADGGSGAMYVLLRTQS